MLERLVDVAAELSAGEMPVPTLKVLLMPLQAKSVALSVECRDGRYPWERVRRSVEILAPLAEEVLAARAALDRQ